MAAGNRLAAFYAARADAALVVTGGLAPCTEGWLAPFSSRLASTREERRFADVLRAVHARRPGPRAICFFHCYSSYRLIEY